MRRFIVLFVSFLLLYSCSSKTIYPKPKDLISKDSMALLIKELFYANTARGLKNNFLQRKVNYHPLIYKKFKIDSARFYNSNFYYTSTIDDYDDILSTVLSLMEKDEKYYTEIRRVKDSIYQDSIKKVRGDLISTPKLEKKN